MVGKIGEQVNGYYEELGKAEQVDLVVVCVLKGAFMFFSDLVRHLRHPCDTQFVQISSYAGTESTKDVKLLSQLNPAHYKGKSVLLVEDMHDSGNSLKQLHSIFAELGPKRIDVAVLLKRSDKPPQVDIRFVGMDCDDFIIGYGLDFDQFGRTLPEILEKV